MFPESRWTSLMKLSIFFNFDMLSFLAQALSPFNTSMTSCRSSSWASGYVDKSNMQSDKRLLVVCMEAALRMSCSSAWAW